MKDIITKLEKERQELDERKAQLEMDIDNYKVIIRTAEDNLNLINSKILYHDKALVLLRNSYEV